MKPRFQPLFEEFKGDNGGGGLSTAEFQAKVLETVGKVKTTTEELTKNYDNLQKETKSAFEELTKLKNEQAASQGELTLAIKKLTLRMGQELRLANGDPIQRIKADPEKRNLLNAAVRMACKAPLSAVHRTTLGEDATPGSTMIVDALADDIYDTLAGYGAWSSFDVRRVGTKTTKFPVKTARAAANFILTEGGDITEDTAKAGTSVDLTLEVIGALLPVSRQLLDDSEFDVTSDVLGDFAEAIAYRLDWACLQADGGADATDGNMTGIFGGGGTAAAAAAGNVTTETTDLEDWIKCLTTVDAGILSRPCKWWMNPQILVRALGVKDSNGRPIFLTALEAPAAGSIGSILGYPVVAAHAAPTANAANAKIAVFGDPGGLVVGMRNGFEMEQSDHAGFTTYERYFRGVARAGVKVRRSQAFAVLTLPGA
jgi:HK97 family phage major capsid protein